MIYIGIDNGLKGGIAIIYQGKLELYVMPVFSDGKRNRVDVVRLAEILMMKNAIVVYESVAGSKSVKAAVSMADSFARVESVLILNKIKREPITACKWQKMFWTVPKMPKGVKFDTKAAALNVARRIWPEQSWLANDRCKTPHDGLVDSALISEYCRRLYK